MSQTASGKTIAQIITAARYLVNDRTSPYFSDDDEMLRWGNDGRFQICKDGHGIQTSESIDLVADTLEYTPTANYIKIETVLYTNASSEVIALKQGSPAKISRTFNITDPAYWYEWDGKIGIYPTLSSVTTEKVRPYMITMPTDLALSGSVDTPAVFDLALTYYIVSQHFFKDHKFAASAQATAKFNDEIVKARLELNRIEQDQ